MQIFIGNLVAGTAGFLVIFLVVNRLEKSAFSAPFFVVVGGLVCAVLSTMFGYVSTLVILLLYGILAAIDLFRFRRQSTKKTDPEKNNFFRPR